jgi:uncharacterized membrane protein
MAVRKSPEEHPPGDDTALLIASLEHFRTLRETRLDRGLQLVNYFLVAVAVLASAYVSAINGKHYGIAVVIALSGTVLTAVTFAAGFRQRRSARGIQPVLATLQDRIADELGIDLIRYSQSQPRNVPMYVPAGIAFGLACLLSIGAALYALIH